MKFRLLEADEIEVKVKQVSDKGAVALLYKTARVDMDILDETVPEWSDDYKEIKGNLYCGITIGNITKWDCGIESREDEEGNQKKGEASDAFKRAGFKWGIGRELYSSPFIFIPADKIKIVLNKAGKPTTYDKFHVEKIKYDEKTSKIIALSIMNQANQRVFVWQK